MRDVACPVLQYNSDGNTVPYLMISMEGEGYCTYHSGGILYLLVSLEGGGVTVPNDHSGGILYLLVSLGGRVLYLVPIDQSGG